jgi:hypothetical protein
MVRPLHKDMIKRGKSYQDVENKILCENVRDASSIETNIKEEILGEEKQKLTFIIMGGINRKLSLM